MIVLILLFSAVSGYNEEVFVSDNNFSNHTIYSYVYNSNEKGYIFEGISKNKNFRKCMKHANMIYRYIEYHAD